MLATESVRNESQLSSVTDLSNDLSIENLSCCLSGCMIALNVAIELDLPSFALETFYLGIEDIGMIILALVLDLDKRLTAADQDLLIADWLYQRAIMRSHVQLNQFPRSICTATILLGIESFSIGMEIVCLPVMMVWATKSVDIVTCYAARIAHARQVQLGRSRPTA